MDELRERLDQHQSLRQQIFEYFGYVEDYRILPLEDSTGYYWRLSGEGPGEVSFAEAAKTLDSDGDYYEDEIYTQRFLPKWVYRGADYTLIVVDTHTDGNKLLRVFANSKERPDTGLDNKALTEGETSG